MRFIDIISNYYRSRYRNYTNNYYIGSDDSDIMLYDFRVTETTYETPMGNLGIPYSTLKFPAYVVSKGFRGSVRLPKTPLSILRNVIGINNYITSWKEREEPNDNPLLYSVYGLVLDSNMVPIMEITSRKKKEDDIIEAVVIRINSIYSTREHPLFKYIYNSVIKNCIGERIGRIPVEIHILENFKSPLYIPNPEFFETAKHEEEIHNILTRNADDIISYIMR